MQIKVPVIQCQLLATRGNYRKIQGTYYDSVYQRQANTGSNGEEQLLQLQEPEEITPKQPTRHQFQGTKH